MSILFYSYDVTIQAADVVKHSESLLMAVSAVASQQQSIETEMHIKLKRVQTKRDTLKASEEELGNYCDADSQVNTENIAQQQQQYKLIEEKALSLQKQIQLARKALHLPPSYFNYPPSNSNVSMSGSVDGDATFLADLIHFNVKDQGNNRDSQNGGISHFMTALDTIISSKLAVRICKDGKDAANVMKRIQEDRNDYQGHMQGVRIWPINKLTVATRRSCGFLEVLKAFPDKAVDPISLLFLSPEACGIFGANGKDDIVKEPEGVTEAGGGEGGAADGAGADHFSLLKVRISLIFQ